MLFVSDEPFGLAAIVAYVSSLALTIILFSAPYFASYFINYYKKLHQIEEAILLLSEKGETEVQASVEPIEQSTDSFSAVSEIEESDIEPDDQLLAEIEGHALENQFLSSKENDGKPSVAAEGTPHSLKPSTKKIQEDEGDDAQLSLFSAASDSSESKGALGDSGSGEQSLFEDRDDQEPLQPITILAYVLLDPQHGDLYVRGIPESMGEHSQKMDLIDVGKYQLSLESSESFEIQFWANDKVPSTSPSLSVEPGETYEVYPEF